MNRVPSQVLSPKDLIEISSEYMPMNFPYKKEQFHTVVASATAETINAEPLTSPLFTQEREVIATPSVSLIVSQQQHAAANSSKHIFK